MKNRTLSQVLIFWSFVAIMGDPFFIYYFLQGKKPIEEITKTEIVNSDFTRVNSQLTKSKAIIDSLFVLMGQIRTSKPECDSVCQEAVDRELRKVNSKKNSGGNSTGFYYDEYKKMLVAYSKLEETISKQKDSVQIVYRYVNKDKIVKIPVPAEFSKEQTFNIWVGRFFWVILAVVIFLKVRKTIA